MQDKLFAKEEEYIREERKKRIFVEDPKPNFDIPKEREIFQGDADDRKALLKHRKWLEEERKRLDALIREKWKKKNSAQSVKKPI